MFPLSNMMKTFVRIGALKVIDAKGKAHMFSGQPGPSATMRINDPALYYKLFFNPELNAGEAYMDGRLSFEDGDLRTFLDLFYLNTNALNSYPLQHVLRKISKAFRKSQQNNAKSKAQKNVAHHYDLGNEFYKLFLDEDMQYSCAFFENENDTLEDAQRNKLRLVASKLNLQPGLKILDIGSGWGGLAIYLASLEDVEVLGVTLSTEQCALANERARAAGVADRVRFELRDYRDLDETFDRIVSVGMFEHVGVHNYGEFFGKINSLLHEDGVALLHSIGHMSPPSFASPWMRKYIFPGAYSPALSEVFEAAEPNRLWVTDVEVLRVHYADTLREWEKPFQANRDKVEAMYGARFCRMWEFYLVSAEMMFRTGAQMVFHMQLAHKRDAVPVTRDYMSDRRQQFRARESEWPGPVRDSVASGD